MPLDSSQIVIISCAVFKHQIEDLIPAGLREQVLFLDYGLHRVPSKLKESIQEIINNIDKPSTILLAYGLCGNGLIFFCCCATVLLVYFVIGDIVLQIFNDITYQLGVNYY